MIPSFKNFQFLIFENFYKFSEWLSWLVFLDTGKYVLIRKLIPKIPRKAQESSTELLENDIRRLKEIGQFFMQKFRNSTEF